MARTASLDISQFPRKGVFLGSSCLFVLMNRSDPLSRDRLRQNGLSACGASLRRPRHFDESPRNADDSLTTPRIAGAKVGAMTIPDMRTSP